MQIIRAAEGETTERTGDAIFEGAQVWSRPLASESADFTSAVVSFAAGARTRPHRHSSDQILFVVSGIGKVGDAGGEHVITAGDMAVIPANVSHWDGASDTGSPMSHLMVVGATSVTTVDD